MKRKISLFVAVVIFLHLISFFAVYGFDGEKSVLKEIQLVQNDDYFAELGISKPKSEIAATDFSLKSLDGEEKKLSDFQGKVVFLNFWATWCGPCKAEVKDIDQLYDTLEDEAFTVMAVDIREDRKRVRSFMKKNKIDFPVYIDSTGEVAAEYAVTGIPTTYIIDPDGKIVGRAIGPRDWGSAKSISFMRSLMK